MFVSSVKPLVLFSSFCFLLYRIMVNGMHKQYIASSKMFTLFFHPLVGIPLYAHAQTAYFQSLITHLLIKRDIPFLQNLLGSFRVGTIDGILWEEIGEIQIVFTYIIPVFHFLTSLSLITTSLQGHSHIKHSCLGYITYASPSLSLQSSSW